jgi:hypothetical protein
VKKGLLLNTSKVQWKEFSKQCLPEQRKQGTFTGETYIYSYRSYSSGVQAGTFLSMLSSRLHISCSRKWGQECLWAENLIL